MSRLSKAGYKRDFVNATLIPDWWDDDCEQQVNVLQELEIRIARFLKLPLSDIRNPDSPLRTPAYPNAQLRQVRDIDRDKLSPAIHAAIQIAAATVRSMRNKPSTVLLPSVDPNIWRKELINTGNSVKLDRVLSSLWHLGIPVIPIENLPAPSFQGFACVVEKCPVIVIGHKFDEPSHVAFLVAHEVAHLTAGDCREDMPVVDYEENVSDESDIERKADAFASFVMTGSKSSFDLAGSDFKDLARNAIALEKKEGIDAGTLIFAWAKKTKKYDIATLAVKALYRHCGARNTLNKFFFENVDLDSASDTDRDLLKSVTAKNA